MGIITDFDHGVVHLVNGLAHRQFLFDQVVVNILGLPFVKMGPIALAAIWAISTTRDQRKPLVLIALGIAGAMALSFTVQGLMPSRPRPLYTPGLGLQLPFGMKSGILADWSSFPSDHAALVFAMSFAVWQFHRVAGVVALVWATFVVCVPRMFMGLHFPTDLIGGALIGISVVALLPRTPFLAWGHAVLDRPLARHPAVLPTLTMLTIYMFITMFIDLRRIGHMTGKYFGVD